MVNPTLSREHHLVPASTCLLGLVAVAAGADIVRVDFGAADSAVMSGFTQVTPETSYGKDANVGWLDTTGLAAFDRPRPDTSFQKDVYTNELRQDRVESRGAATLRIDAPAGRYRVWIMVGPGTGERKDRAQIWDVRITNGTHSATATGYGETRCRALRLDGEASSDGHLDLSIFTRSKWGLNALVVVPMTAWPGFEANEVPKLEQIIHLLPDRVLAGANPGRLGSKKWKHVPHVDATPPPTYTAQEKARGFVVHRRPWIANVWPNTVPRRADFDRVLETFASPDEYEPLTFTVMPLRDFATAEIIVSDLVSENDDVIPSSDVERRFVQYKWVKPGYGMFGEYYRAPDVLPRFERPQPLTAGENFRAWMTVRVGPFAASGTYRGRVELRLDGQAATELPLVLRVLPIKLQKDPSIIYSTYYRYRDFFVRDAPDDFSRRWWARKIENDMASMAAHGYASFLNSIDSKSVRKAGDTWIANFDTLQARLDLARRHGLDTEKPVVVQFTNPLRDLYEHHMDGKQIPSHIKGIQMPPPAFFEDVTGMVTAFEAERRLRGLPELLYYPIDEPTRSTPVSMDFMVALFKAIRKVPDVRIYVTADPAEEAFAPMKPYADFWCNFWPSLSPDEVEVDRKRGVVQWLYPNHVSGGDNDHTPVAGARITYGFWLWRGGYRGLMPWTFEACSGDPENYLDTTLMDFGNHTDDDASVLPVTLYEGVREGIDDGRYVYTLQRWIDKARALGHGDAADRAESDLEAILDSVDLAAVTKVLKERRVYDTGWPDDRFDRNRWMLAQHILRLRELCAPD
ncbi:MAG: hypothetical protein CMJ18_19695 [Phycisphaeraceae bacterium]|nr:hypothetical protein [Phycisphaeraceae bacterium]